MVGKNNWRSLTSAPRIGGWAQGRDLGLSSSGDVGPNGISKNVGNPQSSLDNAAAHAPASNSRVGMKAVLAYQPTMRHE